MDVVCAYDWYSCKTVFQNEATQNGTLFILEILKNIKAMSYFSSFLARENRIESSNFSNVMPNLETEKSEDSIMLILFCNFFFVFGT